MASPPLRARRRSAPTSLLRLGAAGVAATSLAFGAFGAFGALSALGTLGSACTVGPLMAVEGDGGNPFEGDAADASDGEPTPLDGGSCAPGDVRTFVPLAYRAATPEWQDVCTQEQLGAFYAACFDTDASVATCQAFSALDDASAACAACVLTPATAGNYGPIVDHGSFVTANVGGCIELTDPSGLTCAKAQQGLSGCELAACQANCPVSGPSSRQALDQCTSLAASTGCQMFAQQASCAADLADAGVSAACTSPSFRAFYDSVVPLFCGPPPPADAAAPPPDAGPSEASTSSDAGADARSSDAGYAEAGAADALPSDASGAPATDGPDGTAD